MKSILYYTDNRLREPFFSAVQARLLKANLPIISVSLKPMDFGRNIHYKGKRGYLTMFKQILTGLKASKTDYIFFCEHDVLYHPSHFDFEPKKDNVYYYNNNVWKYKPSTGQVVGYDCRWLSQLCASKKILLDHYKRKIHLIEAEGKKLWNYRFEPGTKKGIDNYKTKWFYSKFPNIDIKHGKNLMGTSRFHPSEFVGKPEKVCPNFEETTVDKIPGWNKKSLLNL